MKRRDLLQQIRALLNRLAVELVEDDLLDAAQLAIAASMSATECEGKLADAGEDEAETKAEQPP